VLILCGTGNQKKGVLVWVCASLGVYSLSGIAAVRSAYFIAFKSA
jgi:hypothetical protein